MKTQRVRPVSRSCFRAFLLLLVALCFLRLSSADASENYIFAVYPVHDPNRMLTAFQPLADGQRPDQGKGHQNVHVQAK